MRLHGARASRIGWRRGRRGSLIARSLENSRTPADICAALTKKGSETAHGNSVRDATQLESPACELATRVGGALAFEVSNGGCRREVY
jgi:hypothetical protein